MHRTRNISLWCVLINGLPSGIYVRVYGVDNAPIAIKTMDARKSGAPQRTAFITPPPPTRASAVAAALLGLASVGKKLYNTPLTT